MEITKWIWAALFSLPCLANDTPFLKYECAYGRATYALEFTNDDSHETRVWDLSSFKKTKIRFEKNDKRFVKVRITSGLPLISYAAPEEYKFSAPLVTDNFDFTLTQKNPLMDGVIFSLNCVKSEQD